MTKRLLLFRHGKSDWSAEYGSDHDRPLARRGIRAAALMGRYLAELGQVPDAVLCSTALRARQTLELAAEAGSWKVPVELREELYATSAGEVVELLRDRDDDRRSLLLVGHEPTWSTLAGGLIGGAGLKFPTACMARIDLDVASWSALAFDRGVLVWLVTPKLLGKLGRSRDINRG